MAARIQFQAGSRTSCVCKHVWERPGRPGPSQSPLGLITAGFSAGCHEVKPTFGCC